MATVYTDDTESSPVDPFVLRSACDALALFPLPGTVLLPGSALPLHVFEPRYRQLVKDVLVNGFMTIPQLRPDGDGAYFPYACMGKILAHRELADGRFNILVQPVARIRLGEELLGLPQPYRMGRAELLEEKPFIPRDLEHIGARLLALIGPLLGGMGERGVEMRRGLASMDLLKVAEAVAPFVVGDPDERQAYIAENDPVARAVLVETAVLGVMAALGAGTGDA